MNNLKSRLFILFCLIGLRGFGQQISANNKIEKLISNCIDSAFASSVYIIEYDTLTKKVQEGAGFSGVVVSAEGHILTVSHAAQPNQVYLISFPDGAEQVAVGMGRIGIQNKEVDLDLAMLKIMKPGKWPFAKMGLGKQMKLHQPAISISYPSSFVKKLPNVRFGRLTDIDFTDGFIKSTCKMEPGDSGGPLFNAAGQVIGLHSWINVDEDENYDVPIDLYLKYWSALNVAKDYKEIPEADELPVSNTSVDIPPISSVQELSGISSAHSNCVVKLMSQLGVRQVIILGTTIEFTYLSGTTTYIVSKSSMLADDPEISINGKVFKAKVVNRDKDNDLVLLKIPATLPNGIKLKYGDQFPEVSLKNLGTLLISALGAGEKKVGILSSSYINMPMISSTGYFGGNATYIDQKITITQIGKGSAAERHLQLNDQITSINGVVLNKPADYGKELAKYSAGDSISIDAIRVGKSLHLKMYLPAYPTAKHVSNEFSGGTSIRSDGFEKVLIQDAAIRADECGSPVFNNAGEFYGINIARHSRTSTVIMPVSQILRFIQKSCLIRNNKS